MLYETDTTVFNTDTAWILVPVNTVGVMGAGLALETRLRYPAIMRPYQEACKSELQVGYPLRLTLDEGRFVLFPTKRHWRAPSRMAWIDNGIHRMVQWDVSSIAIPRLGAGLGKLDWAAVWSHIRAPLKAWDAEVWLCHDTAAPRGVEMCMLRRLHREHTDILAGQCLHRFRDLRHHTNKYTYERIFRHLYDKCSQTI